MKQEIVKKAVAEFIKSRDFEVNEHGIMVYTCGPHSFNAQPMFEDVVEFALTFDDLKRLVPLEKVKDGWISVNDRLPEVGSRVLVFEQGGFIQICNYGHHYYNGKPKVLAFHDEADEQPSICNPTHWQPLPIAPQSSGTD